MNKFFKKYRFLIIALCISIFVLILFPEKGVRSLFFVGDNVINFVFILTPIFICIGLMDVWVDRETIIRMLGEKSGIRGILLSFLLGVITAVPLYGLLPIAGMLLKKGTKVSNVLIFICSCVSIRIPLLLFEASSLGWKFTALRFVLNIFVVLIIAFIVDKALTDKDKDMVYERVQNL